MELLGWRTTRFLLHISSPKPVELVQNSLCASGRLEVCSSAAPCELGKTRENSRIQSTVLGKQAWEPQPDVTWCDLL